MVGPDSELRDRARTGGAPFEPHARRATRRAFVRDGVAGQQLDDLLAGAVEVHALVDEHLRRHALALADQPEQDVLGADVVVPELERLLERQLEHLLGPGRERDVARRGLPAVADDPLDVGPGPPERHAEGLKRRRRDPLTLVDQPEQDVLGADVVVVEEAGLLLGEDDDATRPVREPFEHRPPSAGGVSVPPRLLPSVRARRLQFRPQRVGDAHGFVRSRA